MISISLFVYPSEYMDNWEKFNEITDADYPHVKRVCEDFQVRNFGDYHDLYVQSDTLLLDDVFENFQNMCLEIYKLDSAHFLFAPGLAWQAALKRLKKN